MNEWTASPWHHRPGGWKLLTWFHIPFRSRPETNYLSRLRIVQTPWFAIYLHRFDQPDVPLLHDHPWPFVSVILSGGYDEQRPTGRRVHRRINFVRATDAHYVERLHRTPTWTLLLVGRRRRNWGYIRPTEAGFSWTAWDLDTGHKHGS